MKRTTARRVAGTTIVAGALFCALVPNGGPAKATTTPINPWNYTMSIPNRDGMSIKGMPNSLNQIFTVKDPYGAPIVSVGHVGGLSVFGDQIRVFAPNTLDNPVAVIGFDGRISLSGPNAGVYIDGQLLTAGDIKWIHEHE